MREILFRGKEKYNGKWFEGDLLREKDVFGIVNTRIYQIRGNDYFAKYDVDPETVCQYTGLTDKNGKKIFEGDIVKYIDHEYIGKIIFKEGGFKINWGFYDQMLKKDLFFWTNKRDIEVIGNIFDNPDLLTTSHTDSD